MKKMYSNPELELVLFGFDVITSSGTEPVDPFSDESELNTTGHDNNSDWVNS